LSLWDLKLSPLASSIAFSLYLNFVPMGFETSTWSMIITFCDIFELCPYGI